MVVLGIFGRLVVFGIRGVDLQEHEHPRGAAPVSISRRSQR